VVRLGLLATRRGGYCWLERRDPVRVRPQGDWWSDSDTTPFAATLVAAVRAVTTVASHPETHAMTGIDYRAYYIQNTCGATRRMRSGQSGRPSNQ
jgi:hypothetical protein